MKSYYKGNEVKSLRHAGSDVVALVHRSSLGYIDEEVTSTLNTSPPVASYSSFAVTGDHGAGAMLTAPSVTWQNADSVVREWLVGEDVVATGVTTFSGTADGDLVRYRETATNTAGSTVKTTWWFAVSDVAQHVHDTSLAEVEAMLTGLSGGSANMEVFSTLDHDTKSYERNPNLWASSLVSQLCGAVAWKNHGTLESYGGVLISPRHVLYCYHAHPHADGTWIYPHGETVLRWVLPDDTVVEAVQICQYDRSEAKPGYASLASLGLSVPLDLCVATLDRDVQALGVPVLQIIGYRSTYERNAVLENSTPIINVSQGAGRVTSSVPPTPLSDYPQYNKSMVAIGPGQRTSAPTNLFDYSVWDGDSGTPAFLVCDGVVYLEGIITTLGWGRVTPGLYIDAINGMIAASDAGAVAMGRLSAPTGITVSSVTLPTT